MCVCVCACMCVTRLPREELLKLADDATCIRAYHPFAAPLDMLGWEQEA